MNIQTLDADVQKQQQVLRTLEANQKGQQAQARAAKAKSRAAKIGYKKLRTEAKCAKALLLEVEEHVEQQRRIVAKAQKRLAKAAKKAPKTARTGKPVPKAAALARKPAQKLPAVHPAPTIPPDGKGPLLPSVQRPGGAPSTISSARPG